MGHILSNRIVDLILRTVIDSVISKIVDKINQKYDDQEKIEEDKKQYAPKPDETKPQQHGE